MAAPALATVTIAQCWGRAPMLFPFTRTNTWSLREPVCRPVSIPDLQMRTDNVPAVQGLAGQGQV